ncbi:hypothetical protein JCGZ_26611 [Jatropha curcas]|uniref:Uncharacterized protein n=1 Tax=Jatropha curcas TaxID=180498 RepID=A0A067JKH0_JATCU|nr:hypothetical protein JCGZ_26611 [Jatropha curcas]
MKERTGKRQRFSVDERGVDVVGKSQSRRIDAIPIVSLPATATHTKDERRERDEIDVVVRLGLAAARSSGHQKTRGEWGTPALAKEGRRRREKGKKVVLEFFGPFRFNSNRLGSIQ